MRIGILGGTFDPIHQGHLKLAAAAKAQAGLDRVLFIPAFIPPHKAERRDMTPAPYRYRMVEIALRDFPDFEISDIEYVRPDISYTVDTLCELKQKHPRDEFFLILGADSVKEIPSWREPEEILKLASSIVAVPRPGFEAEAPGANIRWISMPPCGLSSSELRNQMQQGRLKNPEDLPAGVLEFILNKGLYGGRLCQSS